ncbi:reverse transcriptase domain, reverse transcriptase zinc-binding domain protein [Tanacetum coccineum]
MKWELEAEKRGLSDNERDIWMEIRKRWMEKEKEYSNMLHQKARIRWDVEGDENSKFFHSFMKRRNNKCNLRGLLVNGVWYEDPMIIKAEMARHYRSLFSEAGKSRPIFCSSKVGRISVDDAQRLEMILSENEVWEAIFGCGGDKASEPDGFNFKFIRKVWEIIKPDLLGAVAWVWEYMKISRGCSASFVTTIPKVADPIGLGDYRPISLIGCYYKIIAKLLAERVKRVVGDVVGEVQKMFIKARYILDAVLISNETMEFLKSSSMSILVNGYPSEEFGLERGVRQGDPLSHFLFILAAEGLNAIVSEAAEKGIFRGVVCFEEVSGLRVNYNKSNIYGIGLNEEELTEMARWMGYGVGEFLFTYLGVPVGENMRRIKSWGPVVEKFKKWLTDWKAKTISFGGRLTLVKSVIGSLPLYHFSMFRVDRWVDNQRLCDRFPRLYHLDRRKESSMLEKGSWVNGTWCWEWDWIREIRCRINKELEELLGVLQNVIILNDYRDKWRWTLGEDRKFTVKDLSRLVEEKIIHADSGGQETLWNKLVPKKVNIFVWRALKGRLPVRVELDRIGIDLDSVLCPSCNNKVETCAHCLTTCGLAMSVWEKIFNWWKVRDVNVFSIDEFFASNGNVNVPTFLSRVWQVVVWSRYFISKARNVRVFGQKVSSTNKIVQDIQLKSYE